MKGITSTLLAALLCGCSVDLGVQTDTQVSCTDTGDCPAGTECRLDAGFCGSVDSGCIERVPEGLRAVADGNECTLDGGATGTCLDGVCGAYCDDGVFTPEFENCDDGGDSPNCDRDCTAVICGDGLVNRIAGEQCDAEGDSPTCREDCRLKQRLDLGDGHTCVLVDGRIKCWGVGANGRIGGPSGVGFLPGQMGGNLPPVDIGPGARATVVAAGFGHTCAVDVQGIAKCWGAGAFGQLGNGDGGDVGDEPNEMGAFLPAVDLGPGLETVTLSLGSFHSCALLSDGRVKCFGENNEGLLGAGVAAGSNPALLNLGDNLGEMGGSLPFVQLGTGRRAIQVQAGLGFSCALLDNATVKCWGTQSQGVLGDAGLLTQVVGGSANQMGDALPPVNLGDSVVPVAISASTLHTCALLEGGAIKCWGSNSSGQLGYGHIESVGDALGEMGSFLAAVDLGTDARVTSISAGGGHTCAVLEGGRIKCWGLNSAGQLGLGDTEDRGDQPGEMGDSLPFVELGDGAVANTVVAGESHTCAWLNDERLKCWGSNGSGELGLGDENNRGDEPGEMGDNLAAVDIGPVE